MLCVCVRAGSDLKIKQYQCGNHSALVFWGVFLHRYSHMEAITKLLI